MKKLGVYLIFCGAFLTASHANAGWRVINSISDGNLYAYEDTPTMSRNGIINIKMRTTYNGRSFRQIPMLGGYTYDGIVESFLVDCKNLMGYENFGRVYLWGDTIAHQPTQGEEDTRRRRENQMGGPRYFEINPGSTTFIAAMNQCKNAIKL